jgi:hypothetical protein
MMLAVPLRTNFFLLPSSYAFLSPPAAPLALPQLISLPPYSTSLLTFSLFPSFFP